MFRSALLLFVVFGVFLTGCIESETPKTLFSKLRPSDTGIDFENNLSFDQKFNIYTYRNFYNGGGVGLGDINNDGWLDVYLTANQGPNKLFLNKGNFKFEDITEKAGVGGTKAWSTGVSMADVNGDGWLDIYVCNSGDVQGDNKENELFINNGDLTFTERAREFGVADRGFTTHAAFFDFDRDTDLDLYILNNSYQAIGSFNLRKNERPKRDSLGGDKLLRNDDGQFVDVSEQAGIYGSVIGFGLGVSIGDIDQDGWPDIYVSNDFFERDYLYINNQNGSFREVLTEKVRVVSAASMGADIADINNDGLPDIFVSDMLPKKNERLKTITSFDNWDRYQYSVSNDYYHQFNRNVLQLNNGDGTFSEVGRLGQVEATDWSWGALMFDMDNDGLKDIFVANGIYQDLTNLDYLQYVSNEEVIRSIITDKSVDYKSLVELIPSNAVADFAFHNEGNLKFTDRAKEWGIGDDNFSNGSAYGDLDNDGDLDLVINAVNSKASVLRNETNTVNSNYRYLKFELKGLDKNTAAFGTKITARANGQVFYIEQMPNRGFESSMDPRPNVGFGEIDTVDIEVEWPNGKVTQLSRVATNQTLRLDQKDGVQLKKETPAVNSLFEVVPHTGIDYVHHENEFVDFDRDKLVYHMLSAEGPRVAVGDVNGDGREDCYIGGAKDSGGALFVQAADGKFKARPQRAFEADKASEDQGSIFFDADSDGDADLYVCSGSNEFSTSSIALADRLYINDGRGNFSKSEQVLPTFNFESTSTVKPCDYDNDGDMDLFVGGRSHPFLYGAPMNGYILNNDGKGKFNDVSSQIAPGLREVGMITDATWSDIDGDKRMDLILVGEYMPVKVFMNKSGRFNDNTEPSGLTKSNGWWRRIVPADLDSDGDIDLVVANAGLNSRFRASLSEPITMYVNDFDKNGSVEQIICAYADGQSYPVVLRHDLMTQIPSLKKKYLKYENYKNEKITDIFTPQEMEKALKLEAFQLASVVLLNDGHGVFTTHPLPVEAQYSTMFAIHVSDFDSDGNKDILMGGNLYRVKPEVGRYDASYGVLLKGDGTGQFKSMRSAESGIHWQGEVRDIAPITVGTTSYILVARNNDSVLTVKRR